MDLKSHIKNIRIFHRLILPILELKFKDLESFKIPTFHWDWYDILQNNDRLQLLVAPRGFSKSTLLRINVLFELLVKKEDRNILYVSSTDTKAVEHFGSIVKVLKNPVVKHIFGYKLQALNTHEVIIEQDGINYKVEAVSSNSDKAGTNFEGIRPSLIILDDVEDLEQAGSRDRTNKLQDWILTLLIPTLPSLSEGKVRMINTVLSLDSLTNRILGKTPNSTFLEFSDWKTYFYQALDKNDKSIWESKYPTEILHKEREIKPNSFARNYMNAPLNTSNSLFVETDLEYYDYVSLADFDELFAHSDTTHTAKTTSDFFCNVLAGRSKKDNRIYILDFILTKELLPKKQREYLIKQFFKLEKLKRSTYDKISNDGFEDDVRDEARAKGLYLTNLMFEGVKFQGDKFTHLSRHEDKIKSKTVVFPRRNPYLQIAVSQLLQFSEDNIKSKLKIPDDFCDGLSGVLDNFKLSAPKPMGFKQPIQVNKIGYR